MGYSRYRIFYYTLFAEFQIGNPGLDGREITRSCPPTHYKLRVHQPSSGIIPVNIHDWDLHAEVPTKKSD
jgi:hypothetical protein